MAKIFHTGDFHLDSPFSGLDFSRSEEARKARRGLFERMLSSAKEEGCDIILISGDLFDGTFVTKETKIAVLGAFEGFGGPVVIAPGNHDPYVRGSFYETEKMPENVHIFKSEILDAKHFPHLGISVFGYAFCSDMHPGADFTSLPYLSAGAAGTKIFLAHADLEAKNSKYAPVGKAEIAGKGFKYAALGHVHKEPEVISEKGTYIGYCGFPEGRGFDELGRGGAWVIDIDARGEVLPQRRIFSKKHYEIENIDVTGFSGNASLASHIARIVAGKGYTKDTSLRVILNGLAGDGIPLDQNLLKALIVKSNPLGLIEIRDETAPDLKASTLEKDMTIRGEVYRALLPELASEDAIRRKRAKNALNIALRVLADDYAGLGADSHENFRN